MLGRSFEQVGRRLTGGGHDDRPLIGALECTVRQRRQHPGSHEGRLAASGRTDEQDERPPAESVEHHVLERLAPMEEVPVLGLVRTETPVGSDAGDGLADLLGERGGRRVGR